MDLPRPVCHVPERSPLGADGKLLSIDGRPRRVSDGWRGRVGGHCCSPPRRLDRTVAIDARDLAADPLLATFDGRMSRAAKVDEAIARWSSMMSNSEVETRLRQHGVPCAALLDAESLPKDPQLLHRSLPLRTEWLLRRVLRQRCERRLPHRQGTILSVPERLGVGHRAPSRRSTPSRRVCRQR